MRRISKIICAITVVSHVYAGIWLGAFAGADDTFLNDISAYKNHESVWIQGVSKRVFIGYMFHFPVLVRVPVALEWTWDNFTHSLGSQSNAQADYGLDREWSAIVRPGIHLGDGFIYLLGSMESVKIAEALQQNNTATSKSIALFPYMHYGAGLAFAVAPQTELMAEVRFSQTVSEQLYGFIRGQSDAMPDAPTAFNVNNTQIMIGISYEF